MRRLTIEALEVGAFGFTTSRTDSHKTPNGEPVPSRNADADELLGIGSALGAVGGRVLKQARMHSRAPPVQKGDTNARQSDHTQINPSRRSSNR